MPAPIRFTFDRTLAAPPERVFALVTDLHGAEPWLPRSAVFRGTSEVSPGPVTVGTTYVERSPVGVRRGRVVALDPPRHVVFEQPMTMRPGALGSMDIRVTVELAPAGEGTALHRTVELGFHGPAAWLRHAIARSIGRENARVLDALTGYAAAHPG